MSEESGSFEELVGEALDSLPAEIAAMMSNVDVLVDDEPPARWLEGLPRGHTLFGLYEGIPLTQRATYDRALPDRITIYKGPITRSARSPRAIREQVRRTVIHEVGHHFGMEEERLHELGWG